MLTTIVALLVIFAIFGALGYGGLEWVRRSRGLGSLSVAARELMADAWPARSSMSAAAAQKRIVRAVKQTVVPGVDGRPILPVACTVALSPVEFEGLQAIMSEVIDRCQNRLDTDLVAAGGRPGFHLTVVADPEVARGVVRAVRPVFGQPATSGETQVPPIDKTKVQPIGPTRPAGDESDRTVATALRLVVDGHPIVVGSLFEGASWLLGRDPSQCDVVSGVDTVSRRHLEITFTGGQVWVRDLGSENGTQVRGQRITDQPVAVAEGDVLRVGGYEGIDVVVGEASPYGASEHPTMSPAVAAAPPGALVDPPTRPIPPGAV